MQFNVAQQAPRERSARLEAKQQSSTTEAEAGELAASLRFCKKSIESLLTAGKSQL